MLTAVAESFRRRPYVFVDRVKARSRTHISHAEAVLPCLEARQAAHSADAVVVEAAESAKHERIEGEAVISLQQYGKHDGFID